MTYPTYGTPTYGDTPAAATRTLTLPATITANDLLLAMMAEGQSMVHTWPAGWTEIVDTGGFSMAYRMADGTEDGTTIDVTTGSARGGVYMIHRFSGASALVVPEQANASFSNTAAADCPNLAPSWSTRDVTWCAVAMCNNSGGDNGGVWPTNYADNQLRYPNSGGGLNGVIIFSSRNANAASENPDAYPILGSGGRAFTVGVAFELPAVGRSFIPGYMMRNC